MTITHQKKSQPKVGRNELCSCQSGKKYKKCCTAQNDSAALELKAQGMRLVSLKITSQPIKSDYSEEIRKQLDTCYYLTLSNPKAAIAQCLDAIKRYPDVPQLYNYLAASYQAVGEDDKVVELTVTLYARFPDYLYARTALANFFLAMDALEEIPPLFNNKYTLSDVYPERDEFHVTEVIAFSDIMGRYFAALGDKNAALIYLGILEQLDKTGQGTKQVKKAISLLDRRLKQKSSA